MYEVFLCFTVSFIYYVCVLQMLSMVKLENKTETDKLNLDLEKAQSQVCCLVHNAALILIVVVIFS